MAQPTIKDHSVLFDDEDIALVEQYNWHVQKGGRTFYARGYLKTGKRRETKLVYMHRLLAATDARRTDHKDGNGLNNRRSNLRKADPAQNAANRRKNVAATSSIYKGVHFDPRTCKWRAEVGAYGKRFRLGRFETEIEAAQAYAVKARELYGEFALPTNR